MGDTGSQFLGVFLGAVGILFFWNGESGTSLVYGMEKTKHIIIVILAFIIPIIDTSAVTINRISRGQSPFIGGRDHTTHSLSYLGFSDRQVAILYAGISCISFLLIFLIIKLDVNWNYFHLLFFICYFLIIFIALFLCTRIHKIETRPAAALKQEE